jgi:hypothetical protein
MIALYLRRKVYRIGLLVYSCIEISKNQFLYDLINWPFTVMELPY